MSDKWDKAYSKLMESKFGGYTPRNGLMNEADPYPQQGGSQPQAPAQDGMGDMNQEQPQDGGGQPKQNSGQWDDDIKSQVSDMAGKSMRDLYSALQDDQAKTDFVKNVAGPAFKAQLGIDNIPYKELHGILAGGADAEGDAQATQDDQASQDMESAPKQDPAMGGDQQKPQGNPSMGGQKQQLQQSRY